MTPCHFIFRVPVRKSNIPRDHILVVSLLPNYTRILNCVFKFPNAVFITEVLGLRFPNSFKYQAWRQAITSAPPAEQSITYGPWILYSPIESTIHGQLGGFMSSMMPPEPRPPTVLNTEPPPKFSTKSAFTRLTSAIHVSATAFSGKLNRVFSRKTKIEPASTHSVSETAALKYLK